MCLSFSLPLRSHSDLRIGEYIQFVTNRSFNDVRRVLNGLKEASVESAIRHSSSCESLRRRLDRENFQVLKSSIPYFWIFFRSLDCSCVKKSLQQPEKLHQTALVLKTRRVAFDTTK